MKNLLCFFLALGFGLSAQTHYDTLSPSKDAMIRRLGSQGDNNNYGNYPWVNMHAWSNGGQTVVHRSLIDFDLSQVPDSAYIISARLILQVPPTGTQYASGHYLTEPNDCKLSLISSSWTENGVNWNNQPTINSNYTVQLPAASSAYQSYDLDVKVLVQQMVNDKANSHGFYLKLLNETAYRRMVFASSESNYPDLMPKLILAYDSLPPQNPVQSLVLNPTKDAMIRQFAGAGDPLNYGNYEWLNMHAWTNGGNDVNHRSLIDFDFSAIPAQSRIESAYLVLITDSNSTEYPGGHSFGSDNQCRVNRITGPWQEYQVNWINQPSFSAQNESTIPTSTSAFQNYTLNVTALVQDILSDTANSHGFLIQLATESYYRRMVFGSRDNLNPNCHPRLLVNYRSTIGLSENAQPNLGVAVFPNPSRGIVHFDFSQAVLMRGSIHIYNLSGQVILTQEIDQLQMEIDLSAAAEGLYLYRIESADQSAQQQGKIRLY